MWMMAKKKMKLWGRPQHWSHCVKSPWQPKPLYLSLSKTCFIHPVCCHLSAFVSPMCCSSARPCSPVQPAWQYRGPGAFEEEGLGHSHDNGGCGTVSPSVLPCSTSQLVMTTPGPSQVPVLFAPGSAQDPALPPAPVQTLRNTSKKCGQFRTPGLNRC